MFKIQGRGIFLGYFEEDSRREYKMGAAASKYSDNDFEMVIRASKDLEALLEQLGASGKGLHEKINSAFALGQITQRLAKSMRFLATLRNKLVHERGFDSIPDRASFIRTFEASHEELRQIASNEKKTGYCVIC